MPLTLPVLRLCLWLNLYRGYAFDFTCITGMPETLPVSGVCLRLYLNSAYAFDLDEKLDQSDAYSFWRVMQEVAHSG